MRGNRLGPVGARIVGEVLVGLLDLDRPRCAMRLMIGDLAHHSFDCFGVYATVHVH